MRNKHPTIFELKANTNISRDQQGRLDRAEKKSEKLLGAFETAIDSFEAVITGFHKVLADAQNILSEVSQETATSQKHMGTPPGDDEVSSSRLTY